MTPRYLPKIESILRDPSTAPGAELTLNGLLHWVEPSDYREFVLSIEAAVREGLMERRVKVASPGTGRAVAYFSSILDVPPVVEDPWTDLDLQVTLDDVSTVFLVRKDRDAR